ncbi:MAG: replication factor C large subunit [Nanoarchaeota archaeon]
MKMWVDRYSPKTVSDVVGQDTALSQLRHTIENKGIALLHGPSGTGKTCSVYALAHDLGYEVLELNASDFRDEGNINRIVGGSLQQASLFHKGKVVLVDELDGISGHEDRGGIAELNSLLDLKTHAVVLVANDPWDKKFSTLRKKCALIEFKSVRQESIVKMMKRVCEAEHLDCGEEELKMLARRCGGDVRAALMDLQTVAFGRKTFTASDLELLGEREQEKSVFTALQVILKGKEGIKSMEVLDETNLDMDEFFLWLDENMGREYKYEDLVKGYDMLGKSDVFQGRIRRWQYWRLLVYRKALMTAGVSVSKEQQYYGYTPYKRYERILKMWMANQKYFKRKEISKKLAHETSVSSRYAARYLVPLLRVMYTHGKEVKLKLTDEEKEWLKEY